MYFKIYDAYLPVYALCVVNKNHEIDVDKGADDEDDDKSQKKIKTIVTWMQAKKKTTVLTTIQKKKNKIDRLILAP